MNNIPYNIYDDLRDLYQTNVSFGDGIKLGYWDMPQLKNYDLEAEKCMNKARQHFSTSSKAADIFLKTLGIGTLSLFLNGAAFPLTISREIPIALFLTALAAKTISTIHNRVAKDYINIALDCSYLAHKINPITSDILTLNT